MGEGREVPVQEGVVHGGVSELQLVGPIARPYLGNHRMARDHMMHVLGQLTWRGDGLRRPPGGTPQSICRPALERPPASPISQTSPFDGSFYA
ncbi:hypothetical protein ABB27_03440 [Stenotrophomonas terrae]|uniref:Uncharacterized protein n=1 Tax=Stenotrophomonas terrae TaxID=405446 RepID=A0A0R0D131_9GAMM|nr:hypothetical protein ABB27_03440 [Stenotrophomonas terrae]